MKEGNLKISINDSKCVDDDKRITEQLYLNDLLVEALVKGHKKKKKKDKQNDSRITTDHVITDTSKKRHKKHKKDRYNDSRITTDHVITGTSKKKHKKHKKDRNKDSLCLNEFPNDKQYGKTVNDFSNTTDQSKNSGNELSVDKEPYFNKTIFDPIKEKHKKDSNNDILCLAELPYNKQHKKKEKYLRTVTDHVNTTFGDGEVSVNKEPYLNETIPGSLTKKHKKSKRDRGNDILHLNDFINDKKYKKKENDFRTTTDYVMSTYDNIVGVHSEPYINEPILEPLRKKRKKDNSNGILCLNNFPNDQQYNIKENNSRTITNLGDEININRELYLNEPFPDSWKKTHVSKNLHCLNGLCSDKQYLKKKKRKKNKYDSITPVDQRRYKSGDENIVTLDKPSLNNGSIHDLLDKNNNAVVNGLKDINENVSNINEILQFQMSLDDEYLKKKRKKHKKNKEKVSKTVINNTSQSEDGRMVYDVPYLDGGIPYTKDFSHETVDVNSFKDNSILSIAGKSQSKNPCRHSDELFSNAVSSRKHHKKYKKYIHSKLKNTLEDNDIYQFSNHCNFPNFNDTVSNVQFNKRDKFNDSVITVEDQRNMDIKNIKVTYEQLPHDIVSRTLKRVEKKRKMNPLYAMEASSDSNTIQIPDFCEQIDSDKRIEILPKTISKRNDTKETTDVVETNNVAQISIEINSKDKNIDKNFYGCLDFTENPVDFDVPPLHINETIHNLTENQKKKIWCQGIAIKTGKFSHDEDATIIKNYEDFIKEYPNLDFYNIFGVGRVKIDYNIQKFLKAKHFYVRLGKNLNCRTLISIYKRARLILHPHRAKRKFDTTDIEELKHLQREVNNKWSHIGDTLERTEDNCLQTYRWHSKNISKGKWTEKEEEQLIDAIKKVADTSDLSCNNIKGICWDDVAAEVPTRNSSQCRLYWAYHLAWDKDSKREKWDQSYFGKLLNILRSDWYVENSSEIDWIKVYDSFKDVAPSHIFLHKQWLYLKSKVPEFKTKNYKTILDTLCKLYNITPNETVRAPFSSAARNERISKSIENMREYLGNL